jgi:hypothetical protein
MTRVFETDCEGFHRRDFVKIGSAGLLGLGLADFLRLQAASDSKAPARAKNVIMVWLAGGPSTIDMWDMKPEAPTTIRGEFKPIDTKVPGVQLCEHMPRLAAVLDHCTLVRSLHHTIADHGRGTVYLTTGNKPTPAMQYPSLGSLAAKLLPPELGVPPYAKFGGGGFGNAGFLGPAYNPFTPGRGAAGVELPAGFTPEDLEARNRLLKSFDSSFKTFDESDDLAAGLDKFRQQALDVLRSNKTRKALDLSEESQSVRDQYGNDAFGQGVLSARRLIEAGVRFATVSLGGWDTHNGNFTSLRGRLLPTLDRTLSALIGDMADRGLLKETIVYCAGEFGRTPRVRGNGRDHWARSMAVLLAGGGFRAGYVHGSTDAEGMAPATLPCSPDDVSATIFHCLGIDPLHEIPSNTGRPMYVFREGKVISALVG